MQGTRSCPACNAQPRAPCLDRHSHHGPKFLNHNSALTTLCVCTPIAVLCVQCAPTHSHSAVSLDCASAQRMRLCVQVDADQGCDTRTMRAGGARDNRAGMLRCHGRGGVVQLPRSQSTTGCLHGDTRRRERGCKWTGMRQHEDNERSARPTPNACGFITHGRRPRTHRQRLQRQVHLCPLGRWKEQWRRARLAHQQRMRSRKQPRSQDTHPHG